MNDPSMRNPAYQSLTDQQLSEIDELCDRFDQELVNGDGPRIETILAEAPEAARDGLLAELLAMEFEYRTQQGNEPRRDDYIQRFPQQENVIASVFAREEKAGQFLKTPAAAGSSEVEETMLSKSLDAGDLPDGRDAGEAAFRKYLKPTTRDGWLGRLGHYEIEEVLGRGGFGIVAKAFDEKLHRVVAIKLMHPDLATTSPPRKRFLREARTAAAVTHGNVVAVYAVEEEPIPHLAMEYIAGQTLQQRMDDHGPFDVADVLRIGQQVAAGLAAAHAAHLIHRDIKPANILLTDGALEKAKISDFGLARAVDDASMTSSGLIAGTPMYMAPEQARGEPLDHRADLFSLGSVMYQMASGRPPFRAINTVAVLKRVCEDTPRPLDDVIPETPDWLQSIIFRLLEKNRDDRFQSAQEVADLLARCQRELEHGGKVVLFAPPRSKTTRIATGKKTSNSAWPKWLLAAVLFALAVLIPTIIGPKLALWFETPIPNLPQAEAIGSTDEASATTWRGWPADAPPPAIAPFDADRAKQHLEAWAKYLGVPVEYENSIGMKFRLIPPGEFLMGSPPEEIEAALELIRYPNWRENIESEGPQHKVVLTKPIYIGVTEVTQAQYERLMGANPSSFSATGKGKNAVADLDTANYPVETVSWNDTVEFCSKLSQQEQLKPFYLRSGETVTPLEGTGYRLPTDAEWEYACRAGTTTRSWSGDEDRDLNQVAWSSSNGAGRTHAVGELKVNPFGLWDVYGNVFEWVQDGWDPKFSAQFLEKIAIDPSSPFPELSHRPIRGGDWNTSPPETRSSFRLALPASSRPFYVGFRVVLAVDAVKNALKSQPVTPMTNNNWHGWPADAPAPAIAPFDADGAKQHQESWADYLGLPVEHTNDIGMKFRLIPPGEFLMGSTPEGIEAALHLADSRWREHILSEGPQHQVVLTKPIYFGVTEVTQSQYEQVMGANPSHFSTTGNGKILVTNLETGNHPVEMVTWYDAAGFCAKLSQQEKLKPFYSRSGETVELLEGAGYRLATEAEWEYACRAGTTTRFWSGDQDQDLIQAGSFVSSSGGRTHAVGQSKSNPFGLSDMHGNVWEWVQDGWNSAFYSQFQKNAALDPSSPPLAGQHPSLVRGGDWHSAPFECRSAQRLKTWPNWQRDNMGFRVVLVADAVAKLHGNAKATVPP